MREFALLERVYAASADLGPGVTLPPGDDLAQIRLEGRELLVGVDQLVAGRHYDPATTPLELVGRKAVTRSLSDVAAMAGRPLAALAAVVLPPDMAEAEALALFEAMRRTAGSFDSPLVGGDVAVHAEPTHPLTCSVTVMAEPTTPRPITRGGVRPGDVIYVTGVLGGGSSGHHLTFQPRIAEAIELAAALGDRLHAMIDLSDGLGRDAGHLAGRSKVAIELDAAAIPLHGKVARWIDAAGAGEDYELCFAAAGEVPAHLGDVPVTRIGRAAAHGGPGEPTVVIRDGDRVVPASELGWEHK